MSIFTEYAEGIKVFKKYIDSSMKMRKDKRRKKDRRTGIIAVYEDRRSGIDRRMNLERRTILRRPTAIVRVT